MGRRFLKEKEIIQLCVRAIFGGMNEFYEPQTKAGGGASCREGGKGGKAFGKRHSWYPVVYVKAKGWASENVPTMMRTN